VLSRRQGSGFALHTQEAILLCLLQVCKRAAVWYDGDMPRKSAKHDQPEEEKRNKRQKRHAEEKEAQQPAGKPAKPARKAAKAARRDREAAGEAAGAQLSPFVIAHGEANLREVEIVGIEVQGPVGEPMVILKEVGGNRIVPIWIGPTEAQALYVGWRKIPTPRPLTPDLLLMVMRTLGGELHRVVLTTVALNTYFARLEICDVSGKTHALDARPSDAMALAVRAGVPILATEEMLSRSGITLGEGGTSQADDRAQEDGS